VPLPRGIEKEKTVGDLLAWAKNSATGQENRGKPSSHDHDNRVEISTLTGEGSRQKCTKRYASERRTPAGQSSLFAHEREDPRKRGIRIKWPFWGRSVAGSRGESANNEKDSIGGRSRGKNDSTWDIPRLAEERNYEIPKEGKAEKIASLERGLENSGLRLLVRNKCDEKRRPGVKLIISGV